MDTQPAFGLPAFGFKDLLTHIVGDVAQAVCERNGETKARQAGRSQAAVFTIMGFLPRDAIEAMLAGHCVMFHELMVDSVHDTLRGELDTTRRATRGGIVAMDRAFANNLSRLERYQLRPAEGRRDGAEAAPTPTPEAATPGARASGPVAEPPRAAVRTAADATPGAPGSVADKPAAQTSAAQTPATQTPASQTPASRSSASVTGTAGLFHPSPEAIAACRANPEAMAALEAGDPERFARALGIDQPAEAYLAAAAEKGSVFDRQGPAKWPLASGGQGGPKG